jgi:hypothetical protein
MKAWIKPAAIAFGGIALLGGVAYYLESKRRELRWAVDEAFKEGGYLSGFYGKNPEGIVTEGSPEDFTVNGRFEPTAAQINRSQPRKV